MISSLLIRLLSFVPIGESDPFWLIGLWRPIVRPGGIGTGGSIQHGGFSIGLIPWVIAFALSMLTAEAKAFIRPTQITVVETSSNPKKSLTQFMTKPGNIKSSSQGAAPDCEVSTSICFMLAPPAARSTWVFFNENMQGRCRLGMGSYDYTNQ